MMWSGQCGALAAIQLKLRPWVCNAVCEETSLKVSFVSMIEWLCRKPAGIALTGLEER